MREDLPPLPRAVLSFIGAMFSILGVLIQFVSLLLLFLMGLVGAFEGFEPLGSLLGLLMLMVVQVFGSVMLEFGLVITRGRMPVRPEKMFGWWCCRVCLFWMAALVVPLAITAIVGLCRLEWDAVVTGLVAIGCVWGARYFYRLSERLVL